MRSEVRRGGVAVEEEIQMTQKVIALQACL